MVCSLWPTQRCKCCSVFPPRETLGNLAPWDYISTWHKCQRSEGVVLRNTYRGKHRLTNSFIVFGMLALGRGASVIANPIFMCLPSLQSPCDIGSLGVRGRTGGQVEMGHVAASGFSLPVGNALELCPSSCPAQVAALPLSPVFRIRICIRRGILWCQVIWSYTIVCLCGSSCLAPPPPPLTCSSVLLTFESTPASPSGVFGRLGTVGLQG